MVGRLCTWLRQLAFLAPSLGCCSQLSKPCLAEPHCMPNALGMLGARYARLLVAHGLVGGVAFESCRRHGAPHAPRAIEPHRSALTISPQRPLHNQATRKNARASRSLPRRAPHGVVRSRSEGLPACECHGPGGGRQAERPFEDWQQQRARGRGLLHPACHGAPRTHSSPARAAACSRCCAFAAGTAVGGTLKGHSDGASSTLPTVGE